MSDELTRRFHADVVTRLKAEFVGRDEVIDIVMLAAVAGEHVFLYGPPGTAKSLMVKSFVDHLRCRYFGYLLTRFSEPNEIFGPVDLARLRDGVVATVTEGMLPEAEFIFLDELFNANSAILNNLLTVLNERIYRRGRETHRLPLITAFAASNHLPDDPGLRALFDRFLIRCPVDSLPREQIPALLTSGWAIEKRTASRPVADSALTVDDVRRLNERILDVGLDSILGRYSDLVCKVRDLGIDVSDRRAIKVLKLVAASAVLSGRAEAVVSDLWVLRYVWDRVEQIGPLGALVDAVLRETTDDRPHPRSQPAERVNAEQLAAELERAAAELSGGLKLLELSRLRERVQAAADQAAWVPDAVVREHLLESSNRLLEKIG